MKRYRHNLSNTRLTSFDMGLIIPTATRHVIAGTSVVGGIGAGLQLAPMVHQALTQIKVDTVAIACADRLIWDDAEDFYTGGTTGDKRPEVPYVLAPDDGGWPVGSIMDHLGFPTGVPGLKCDARPLRTLIKWFNENCLDLTIQDPLPLSTASGLDETTYTGDLRVNWPKDRFTTARKEKQLGDEVVIPIIGSAGLTPQSAPVSLTSSSSFGVPSKTSVATVKFTTGSGVTTTYVTRQVTFEEGNSYPYDTWVNVGSDFSYNLSSSTKTLSFKCTGYTYKSVSWSNGSPTFTNAVSGGSADLSSVVIASSGTGVLPGEFNFAMGRARWKMRRNLFGTDYRDLLSFWGVRYSDKRLNYAQTLKRGHQIVDISAVLQTAPGVNSAVGQIAGRGTGFAACRYKQYFEEWSTVIHFVVVRPAPVYVNMYPEQWDIQVREDDYTPELARVDLVPIKNKILFPTGNDEVDEQTWGYANAYDFKRVAYNDVSGSMKTTNVSYHQGRIFETAPQLNSDFLQCNPSGRIFAITDEKIMDQIEACAVKNTFIEKSFVVPNGNPKFIGG